MNGHDVLVVTHPPFEGGVPAKTRILCHHLAALGHRVTVAWYATLAHNPELNVPSWRLHTGQRPMVGSTVAFDQFPGAAVGCWLPELEAPYYRFSSRWSRLIEQHDRHIAVGGPPMVANILAQAGVPHLLWCASDVMADRLDRQARMPLPRAIVDTIITRPWLRAQQAFILARSSLILGVSHYTLDRLSKVGAVASSLEYLPIPVDSARFTPPATSPTGEIVGFAARFEDPRKNLPMLLEAFALLRQRRPQARLRLAGSAPSPQTLEQVQRLGQSDAVDFAGALAFQDLPEFYRSLSVFALPSHQEGLCLAGLEAMACGVPVVSTPCGGPADFVHSGKSGILLADWEPQTMAKGIEQALIERKTLSIGAIELIRAQFSPAAFSDGISRAWQRVWGEAP